VNIIAELCQNHNGSTDHLFEMIESAKQGGATHAKIQALYSDELVFRPQFENYQFSRFGMYRPFNLELERLQKLDLSFEDEVRFVGKCLEVGIIPMITVFTNTGVKRARKAGFKSIKIASYDSTNVPLIDSVLSFTENLFISTGATSINELKFLCDFLTKSKPDCKITLLHCKTEYPNKLESVNLNRMIWLKDFGFPVGFSDHSATFNDEFIRIESRNLPSKIAIHLGADVLERHFTIFKPNETKDGKISILNDDLSDLVNFSKLNTHEQKMYLEQFLNEYESILGSNNFEPSVEEWWNRSYYKGRVQSKF